MAQETRVEETRCSLQTFERNRYFYGKPMTVSDFEAEQRYLIGKHRYVNRLIHGAGVLCGLQVTLPKGFSAERPRVELAEGAALDCCGNLIVVSRSGAADVKGDFDPRGLNYLYIKYAECSKQPVVLAANGSSCEEFFCYNRIQETFEIVASRTPPGGEEAGPVAVRAAASAPTPAAAAGQTAPDAEAVCRGLTEKYFQEHLRTCPGCDDPLVFLAALNPGKGAVDETETAKYRSVVYNNSMLQGLLCDHVADYGNPHRTTAEQVRALQSVNGVGNGAGKPYVDNVNLASKDKTIGVTPDATAPRIDLILAPNAVRVSHLNEDVIKNLFQSSKTVVVEPNVPGKKISLRTTPAAMVTSVGPARVVGASSSYAPEDHAHDLAEGVVGRKHLGADVYASLLQGDGIIRVEPDAAARTVKVSADTAPAEDPKAVSSVTGTKRVGKSKRFAREDHAHDLRINGRAPNESGQFLLTPGANVTIANGRGDNELVISAAAGGKTVMATGVFVFDRVLPYDPPRRSPWIPYGLESESVAVVLAEERAKAIRSAEGPTVAPTNYVGRFGDVFGFDPEAPFLMAEVDYTQKTLQISLKDRRTGPRVSSGANPAGESELRFASPGSLTASGETEPTRAIDPTAEPPSIYTPGERTYRIRWWAIPA